MATEIERITALETHYEHVDKTLTAMGRTLAAIRTEIVGVRETIRTEIDGVRQMVHTDVERVRTELGDRIDDVRTEVAGRMDVLDGRIDGIEQRMADDQPSRSESKLKVALRVIGCWVGTMLTALGAIVGGLYVAARFLLPKLASVVKDAMAAAS